MMLRAKEKFDSDLFNFDKNQDVEVDCKVEVANIAKNSVIYSFEWED